MATSFDVERGTEHLLALFERQEPDGTYHFRDEDVRAFLPLLVLATGGYAERDRWSPAVREVMAEFGAMAGIPDGAGPDEARAIAERYFAANPPNQELLDTFNRFCTEEAPRRASKEAPARPARAAKAARPAKKAKRKKAPSRAKAAPSPRPSPRGERGKKAKAAKAKPAKAARKAKPAKGARAGRRGRGRRSRRA